MHRVILRLAGVVFPALLSAQSAKPATRPAHRPLDGLAAQHLLVLPLQSVTFSDTMGWANKAGPARKYLATVDDEITFAFKDRGLTTWVFADAVTRSAKRNVTLVADPHALDIRELRIGTRPDEWQLHEPLASQLRSLIAVQDARYVLLPVELRTVNSPKGGVAMLHVAVIDARRSHVEWIGDVTGAPASTFSPGIAADLAGRLADLVLPER